MSFSSKIHSITAGLLAGLCLFALPLGAFGQEPPPEPVEVRSLRLGAHPEYTRILIGLSRPTPYQVIPDFTNKEVMVFIPEARVAGGLRSRTLKDRALGPVAVSGAEDGVRIAFVLKNQNTRVFHFLQRQPAVLVLDFQGLPRPVLKTRLGQPAAAPKSPPRKPASGLTQEEIEKIIREDTERKLTQGFEDYQKTLKLYQEQKYEDTVKAVDEFEQQFPGSPYLENLLYLKAEALFRIHNPQPFPVYDEVISAYQYAIRKFPKSKFYDRALFKLGVIFDNMDLPLEARTLYEAGLKHDRRSLYNKARKTRLALMLLREGQLQDAYRAFLKLLETDRKNVEAQKGLFQVAQRLFEQGDYPAARRIFEDAASRWPQQLKDQPQINYFMGELYYQAGDYEKARRHFFDLLNLDPDSRTAHIGLNRIGDSYLLEKRGLAALSTFEKSQRMRPDSPEAQYAKIRLADLGVRDPTLPVRDVVFDLPEYFKPIETYDTIQKEAKSQEILAEVILSRGTAHLQQKQYLEAVREFKKLIPLDPDSRYHQNARNFLMQALVLLIEDYANQQGYLPILYAYSDFRNLNIGDIQNVQTLLQIGESYQAIGMNNEALAFYERVKRKDPNGVYQSRLFLNLGRIHLDQGSYAEAEVVGRTFLTNFPLDPQVPEAMKIVAASFRGRKRYDEALDLYRQLLARADADASEAHYLMAEVWFERGNLEEALREYALTLDTYDRTRGKVPGHVQSAYYKLGLTLYQTGRYRRAIDALLAARRRFPRHFLRDWADFLLADSYDRTDKKAQAVSEFQNFMKTAAQEPLLKQAAEMRIKVLDWEKRIKELL